MDSYFGPEADSRLVKLVPDLTESELEIILNNAEWDDIEYCDLVLYLQTLIDTKVCHEHLNVSGLLQNGKYEVAKKLIDAGLVYTYEQLNECFECFDYPAVEIDMDEERCKYPACCDDYDIIKMKIMESLVSIGIPKTMLYTCWKFYTSSTVAMLMDYDPEMFKFMPEEDENVELCIEGMTMVQSCFDLQTQLKISKLSNFGPSLNIHNGEPFSEFYESVDIKKELFKVKDGNFHLTELWDRAFDMHMRPEFKECKDYSDLVNALDDITLIYNVGSMTYYTTKPDDYFNAIDRLFAVGFAGIEKWVNLVKHRNLDSETRKKLIDNPRQFYELFNYKRIKTT